MNESNSDQSDPWSGSSKTVIYPLKIGLLWRPLATLLGMRGEQTGVALEGDSIHVRVGRLFQADIPLPAVALARAAKCRQFPPGLLCLREGGGLVSLAASTKGIVELVLSRAVESRLLGRKVRLQRLALSLEEGQAFLQELLRRQQILEAQDSTLGQESHDRNHHTTDEEPL